MVHLRATHKVLRSLGPPVSSSDPPDTALGEVRVGPTDDRSVLGTMVDFAKEVRYLASVVERRDESSLAGFEDALARTPCRVNRPMDETVWPDRRSRELLGAPAVKEGY